jgi:hypothetical protein
MLGLHFDYFALPAVNTCGGILVAWDTNAGRSPVPILEQTRSQSRSLSLTIYLLPWLLTMVYGPQEDAKKISVLEEMMSIRTSMVGPWVLCGDFKLIYQAKDKNNDRLSRRMMGRFRRFLNDLELEELHLYDRLFTWRNERTHPMLERIDRMFIFSC